MPDLEQTSPATVASEAPVIGAEPAASAPVEGTTPPSAESGAAPEQTPQKPDVASLLKDPEARKAALAELQAEIEHRAVSEAGRRVKAERETWQHEQERVQAETKRQQDEQAHINAMAARRRELQRQKGLDEFELGTVRKNEIDSEEARLAQDEASLAQQRYQADIDLARQTGTALGTMMLLGEMVNTLHTNKELDADEYAALQPAKFSGPTALTDYRDAVFQSLTKKQAAQLAEKLLKERLPIEVEAKVQERLGEQRDGATNLPNLPAGTPTVHYTRRDLANMSPEDYQKNRDLILGPIIRR